MAWHDNLGVHVRGTSHGGIEFVDLQLKPEEHAVSVWFKTGIADGAMIVVGLPIVQLQDQPPAGNEALVVGPAMGTLTAKQTLKPATARFDIAYADEGLWMQA